MVDNWIVRKLSDLQQIDVIQDINPVKILTSHRVHLVGQSENETVSH